MAEPPESLNKPHPGLTSQARPKPRKKTYTAFLCKSLFVALLLVLLPLFPSRAPEFIKQSLITKLWELLHLLFVGVTVSYGLFGRRNPEINREIQSHLDHSRAYSSGLLHASSIFESGSDEEKNNQTWNPRYLENESQAGISNPRNPGSLIFQNGSENPSGSDQKMVNQSWNSQYFHDESMVVFHQDNSFLDELGKPKSIVDCKPLGLPVRSLRSRIADDETPESSVQGSGSSSGSKGGSSKNSDESSNVEIRGLTPVNLEEKFEETVAVPSPIPWRSRSGRMKVREDMVNVKPPKHPSTQSTGEDMKTSVKPPRHSSPQSTGEDVKTCGKPPSSSRPLSIGEDMKTSLKPPSDSRPLSVGEGMRTTVKPPSHSRPSSTGETMSNGVKPPSRSRPISIGECSGASVKPHSHSRHLSIQEDKGASVKPPPSHSRPLSVGQFELDDHLNSQSFWSSIFSQASSIPSPKKVSPSRTVSPEVSADSKMEDLERNKSSRRSSLQSSQPESVLRNGEASYTRRFSIGSSSEVNEQSSFKDFSKSVREDPLGKGKWRMDSFSTDGKPTSPVKPLARGKSVRTIRASEHALNAPKMGDICSDQMDEKMGKTGDKFKTIGDKKGRRSRLEQRPKDHPRKNLDDDLSLKQTQEVFKYEDEDKQNFAETIAVESERDSESEFENFQVSSDEEEEAQANIFSIAELDPDEVDWKAGEFKASSNEEAAQSDIANDDEAQYDLVDDAEHDHDDEVDRKAGEFIAKFREQIRLQKIASIKGFSGLVGT